MNAPFAPTSDPGEPDPIAQAGRQQRLASDPAVSAFVSASAGSGKTKTLVDRVARLLLRGARPEAILCVTYTKAAAAEMQRRLFQQLGDWSMLDDGALSKRLSDIGEDGRDLSRARTLFARALEAPTFERAQGTADEASFARRAAAVEKERAIAENELSTKVELSRREAALIAQQDENARRVAQGRAEAGRIAAEGDAARIRIVEAANNAAEGERLALLQSADPAVLHAVTLRRFAEKLTKIDTLNVTPDLTGALTGLLKAAPGPKGAGPAS